LTLPEAALLAGLVKSPSSYAPTVSLDRARSRRNVVLEAMVDNGDIDKPTMQAARRTSVTLVDGLHSEEPIGQYFKEQVRQELVDRFGWQRVYQGGLRVFSTIDMKMQHDAEAAIASGLATLDEKRRVIALRKANAKSQTAVSKPSPSAPAGGQKVEEERLQAALVSMDPATGHIRAMVGGRDFSKSRFNRAVQAKRQPGSAFKPFVYAAALEAGFTPATLIENLNAPISTLRVLDP
jgi:penicillin-binding protein 1A